MSKPVNRPHDISADVSRQPALVLANGFQLLALRQFLRPSAPSCFAYIDQSLFRFPDRPGRHGISFELAFLPELVTWLTGEIGAPSVRDENGRPLRNPKWPKLGWQPAERLWPDGARTIEWHAEAVFPGPTLWLSFLNLWGGRLGHSFTKQTDRAAVS